MRELFVNLALFLALSIALSGLTGCGTQGPAENIAVSTANTGTTSSNSNKYPLLASGLAESPFEMVDGTGRKFTDYKGKVMMFNLWGIWCGPCRAEMPHLIELQNKYHDQGFEIVGLNIGDNNGSPENVEAIQKFSEQMKLNYALARIASPAIRQFYAVTKQEVVPQTILVDKEGHLRGVFIGGGQNVSKSMTEVLDKTMAEYN